VVDDDETMRDVLKRMLERTGFDVVTAIHGRDALAKFQQRYADLVITDLNMPEMDGIELIRSLTTDHPTVSIVVISGVADRLKLIDMALRLGAKAAIQKPVMRQEVVQTVRRLLKVGASVQEAAE
jgi:DNA-binding NtrC family response regulator